VLFLDYMSLSPTPPKVKRFVVIAINAAINSSGLLFINSHVNPNVFPNAKLRKLHLALAADQRTYLDSDSHLDCSRLYELALDRLMSKFVAKPGIYLGQLSKADMAKMSQIVTAAKTIEKKLKRRYGFMD